MEFRIARGHRASDHDRDRHHTCDALRAEAFRELTSEGFTAAVRTAEGEACRVFAFDPTARETLFFRRLRGG
ncbi:hypothetical protein [Bradyrhizobium sp. ISRA463]|uniref:hypothetical protein n=1 Tax=unclassified Bradyrhizobium TaxID=2631580 RepID=UPI0032B05513